MKQNCSSSSWDEVAMSATSNARVLISSDDSLEAEAVGEWIHALSPRRMRRLIVLDARCLQSDVRFERYEAHDRFAGSRAADLSTGGTLLLTHLEDMPLGTQTNLCRFLDRGAISESPVLRVVATTDHLVHARMRVGQISEELFYRLNVIHIVLGAAHTHLEPEVAERAPYPRRWIPGGKEALGS